MANFPQVLLRDLPLVSLSEGPYTLVAVDGNRNSIRVPSSVLTIQSVKRIDTIPASLNAAGEEGSLSFSCPSLYSYYNGQWGASPRYTKNIDDLSDDTRFLLVNKEMMLTAEEQATVKASIGLRIATSATPGLVYGTAPEKDGSAPVTVDSGKLYIREATAFDAGVVTTTGEAGAVATKSYVDMQVASVNQELAIPVATTSTIGGVLSGGDGDIFTVAPNGAVNIRQASAGTGIPGIVTVASANIDSQLDAVVPVRLMRSVVGDIVSGTVAPASYTQAGVIKLIGSASGPSGALYFTDAYGTVDVYTASDDRYGVVKTLSSIPGVPSSSDPTTVPTTGAVRNYVQAAITGEEGGGDGGVVISPSVLPKATTSTLGGVIVGSRLSVTACGLINVPIASTASNGYGVIRLSDSYTYNSSLTAATSKALYNANSRLTSCLSKLRNCFNDLNSCFTALKSQVQYLEDTVSSGQ